MRLRQIGLQLQRPLCERPRFFAAFGGAFKNMDDPAFQLRVARNGEREHRIELDGPRVKLLALFELLKFLHPVLKIVRMDKSKIGLSVFRRLAFDSGFFCG